jgi:hypothetical protein
MEGIEGLLERVPVILNHLFGVMAGLVPAIPTIWHRAIPIEIAGTSPAMTPEILLLLPERAPRLLPRPQKT